MSAAHSEAAVERLAAVARRYDDPAERAAHLFLALGILGWQAPEVLEFLLDRADAQLAKKLDPAAEARLDAEFETLTNEQLEQLERRGGRA